MGGAGRDEEAVGRSISRRWPSRRLDSGGGRPGRLAWCGRRSSSTRRASVTAARRRRCRRRRSRAAKGRRAARSARVRRHSTSWISGMRDGCSRPWPGFRRPIARPRKRGRPKVLKPEPGKRIVRWDHVIGPDELEQDIIPGWRSFPESQRLRRRTDLPEAPRVGHGRHAADGGGSYGPRRRLRALKPVLFVTTDSTRTRSRRPVRRCG